MIERLVEYIRELRKGNSIPNWLDREDRQEMRDRNKGIAEACDKILRKIRELGISHD